MDSDFISPEVQETPVKSSNKKWLVIGIAVFLLLSCLCVGGVALAFSSFMNTVAEEIESEASGEFEPIFADEDEDAVEEVLDPNAIKPGMHKVGTDIQPGIYAGNGECYWERLKDLSNTYESILANDNTDGPFYVEVKEGDAVFSIDCPVIPLDKVPAPAGELPQELPAGLFLVGRDIKPGIYRGETEECYWERLSGVSGDFDSILANDNSSGQYYVEVKDTDFAFSTGCPMTAIEALPAPAEPLVRAPAGMYLVGVDIQPGTYKGDGECYWERLADVSGNFEAIITNDNTEGPFYVEIAESDFAFAIDCAIELAE